MTSPDDSDPVRSELEYAPPWVREQAAREQAGREQTAREQTAREQVPREQIASEQITPDQFRAALRQSGAAPLKPPAQSEVDPARQSFDEERPWHLRALEPELVPEPPAEVSSFGPIMLRMGVVCIIAAMVAGAVVFLFSPKQTVHKIAQANISAPAIAVDDASANASESSRDAVPALSLEPAGGASTPAPAPEQVASAAPQSSATSVPPAQQNQLPNQAAAEPQPAAPRQQIASLPPPNSAPADVAPVRAPAINEPAPRPANNSPPGETNPAANPAPVTAPASGAPAQAVPPSAAQPAVALDQNEIATLIRRGKALLNDGDFSAARVLFERAANAGSAEAALALGSTYDPNVIKRLGAIMVRPDVETARKWYQLAADRGSAAASLQLANLPQGR
jgi:TPR repeat protein